MDEIKELLRENNSLLAEVRDELRQVNVRAEQQCETKNPLNDQAAVIMSSVTSMLEKVKNGHN